MQDRQVCRTSGSTRRAVDTARLQRCTGPNGTIRLDAAEHDIRDLIQPVQQRMLHLDLLRHQLLQLDPRYGQFPRVVRVDGDAKLGDIDDGVEDAAKGDVSPNVAPFRCPDRHVERLNKGRNVV